MRIYLYPTIISNISDNEKWVVTKTKPTGLVCDAIKPLFYGIWISKYPLPIYETNEYWILN